jgi:predicted AlkP superfamily phosphohydrolase/phosphomutase
LSKVLLLGLDGMTFSVLGPAFEAGCLPRLKQLIDGGSSGTLRSTIPPFTPPGWVSIYTGVNPGKHGVFGFEVGNIQRPGGPITLGHVRVPAIWNIANAQGRPFGLFNVPVTYPPPSIEGVVVTGMLTPEQEREGSTHFTHPRELGDELIRRLGGYEIDVKIDHRKDWRSPVIVDRLISNTLVKRQALKYVLDAYSDLSMLFVVLEAPDRVLHSYYKYLRPEFDHWKRPEGAMVRERVWELFSRLDEVIADLIDWVGSDSHVLVMSDHGFGPKLKAIDLNLALHGWGLLATRRIGSALYAPWARRLAGVAKQILPINILYRARQAGHQAIDWTQTKAFAAPYSQQGIYVNLEGREPHGIVRQDEYESVRDTIVKRFEELVDPEDGRPVLDRIFRREEVMKGPASEEGPDLFPVCRGYTYELSDGRYSPDVFEDYGSRPHGFHSLDGIFAVAGPGINQSSKLEASVCDITPTALYLAGLKIPELDGRILTQCVSPEFLEKHPIRYDAMKLGAAGEAARGRAYSEVEELEIEKRLSDLGYI